MSKILSPSELNEVKIFAEKLGFTGMILDNDKYAFFKKEFGDFIIKVYYNVIKDNSYTEINCGSLALKTDEYEDFVKVLEEAQSIAKEMEK